MRSARVDTRTRSNVHAGKLLSKHKQEGKWEVLHAGWVSCWLTSQRAFQSIFLSRGGCTKNRTERETEIMKLESVWRLITGTGCPRFRVYFDDTKGGKSLWVDVVPHVCSLLRPTCCRCLQLNVRFLVGPFLLFGGNKQVLFFFSSTTFLVSSAGFIANPLCTRSYVYRV